MDVFRHKPPDVSQYRQTKAGVLTYLKHQLDEVQVGSATDQHLEERSQVLDQKEQLMCQRGFLRYRAAGINFGRSFG
jgi:hypothetical protein